MPSEYCKEQHCFVLITLQTCWIMSKWLMMMTTAYALLGKNISTIAMGSYALTTMWVQVMLTSMQHSTLPLSLFLDTQYVDPNIIESCQLSKLLQRICTAWWISGMLSPKCCCLQTATQCECTSLSPPASGVSFKPMTGRVLTGSSQEKCGMKCGFRAFWSWGVVTGCGGCGPHRAALARGGKPAKIVKKFTWKFRLYVRSTISVSECRS